MKGVPLPLYYEGKGVLDLELFFQNKKFVSDFAPQISSDCFVEKSCLWDHSNFYSSDYNVVEPTSVLDSARISSQPTSSSNLYSSLGGGGGGGGAASTNTAGVSTSPKWQQTDSTTATSSNVGDGADPDLLAVPPILEIGTSAAGTPEKFAMEDWEDVLPESVGVSPSQEHSFFQWIMGDVEDPSIGGVKGSAHIGGCASFAPELDFSCGFPAIVDQGLGSRECFMPAVSTFSGNNRSEKMNSVGSASSLFSSNSATDLKFSQDIMQNPSSQFNSNPYPSPGMKPPIFNPQLLINQHTQSPSFFLPLSYPQHQEPNIFPAKRHNHGGSTDGGFHLGGPFPLADTGQSLHHHHHDHHQQQLQFLPHHLNHMQQQQQQQVPIGMRVKADDCHQLQQAVVDQIYKAAELIQTGNPVLAQGILARLNHQLSPSGNPFIRAAFYCKEALQLLLKNDDNAATLNPSTITSASPFSLVFKIGAYKSFSEISPLVHFSSFTCNQAILEAVDGYSRIHILDFDIGLGGQWASLMQELALQTMNPSGTPTLKITALASPSAHDQLELDLTCETLVQFAGEVNIGFGFHVMDLESLSSSPFHTSDGEVVVVNLPTGCLASCHLSAPFVLRFVKDISPRIVVSVDRGCGRTDLPFANHLIQVLQSCSNVLESLDATDMNIDALQKVERFVLQPEIERIVGVRFRAPERTQHWRDLFLSAGFSPVVFSNLTESQAECMIKRTPVRGFQVEKRQSSLVLCWQRKELVSASAWRCYC